MSFFEIVGFTYVWTSLFYAACKMFGRLDWNEEFPFYAWLIVGCISSLAFPVTQLVGFVIKGVNAWSSESLGEG